MACVSAQLTKDSNWTGTTWPATILYTHWTTFTIPTDWAILVHHLWAAPPALNTLALWGVKILLWTDADNFYARNISWSDFAPATRWWWANYALNPAIWTPDDTVWTIITYATAWMAVGALAQARWNPNACNAIRYWRCESRFTDWDITNWYATFLWYSLIDSAIDNKWNLIDPTDWGYKFQWLMSLWLTATSVDFRDANVVINIINTINVTTAFNRIEVHNANSNIEWTAINISALWTNSKWTFEVIDNATILKTSCTFTDMDTFIYNDWINPNTIISSTYRRCNQITQWGATFDSCIFDKSISATTIVSDDVTNISGCTFNSDGSNYAVDLWIISADIWVTWANNTTDYATVNWTTWNEVIKVSVDTWITLTVNVAAWYNSPTYHNSWLWTVLVVQSRLLKMVVKDEFWVEIVWAYAYIDDDNITPFILNTVTDENWEVSISYGWTNIIWARWRIRKYWYKPYSASVDIGADAITIPVTLVIDPQQT